MSTRGGPAILQDMRKRSVPSAELWQVDGQLPCYVAADLAVQVPPVQGYQIVSRSGEFKPLFQHLQGIGKNLLRSLRRMDTV